MLIWTYMNFHCTESNEWIILIHFLIVYLNVTAQSNEITNNLNWPTFRSQSFFSQSIHHTPALICWAWNYTALYTAYTHKLTACSNLHKMSVNNNHFFGFKLTWRICSQQIEKVFPPTHIAHHPESARWRVCVESVWI